jgi:DNA processing protein
MHRILYALTHVASQRIYRWLPWPDLGDSPFDPVEALLEVVPHPDWMRGVLAAERARLQPRLTWLEAYINRYDPEAAGLIGDTVRLIQLCATYGAQWICPVDDSYPPLLRSIADPPAGLVVSGDIELLRRPLVAVVGSRQASAASVRMARSIGQYLAEQGVTVVSGGALGCDIAAHHGVLTSGIMPAPACCVFAGGLQSLYPNANAYVFDRLRERRAVLMSERLWGMPCERYAFHARNRLICGMSGTTLLIQAADRSGAMMTARLALEQGRDVAVMRHEDDDIRAAGGQALIREGAVAFGSVEELMAHLKPQAAGPAD